MNRIAKRRAGNRPVVSVVMPVRNGGAYLSEAVESILNQSFRDLELVLVNDHSEDDAIATLGQADSRLRVIHNPGHGVVEAFNHGLGEARGDFIARMDADDIALPHRLQLQLDYMAAHPAIDICGGCVELFSSQGIAGGNLRYQNWLNACRAPVQIHQQLFIESPIPNPSAMFRRAAIDHLGGYNDPAWPEDYDLYLRADACGMRMGKPDGVVLKWREHEQRLTRAAPRYDIEQFQAAKAHYLAHYRIEGRTVIIWGAGPSGRLMHDLLLQQNVRIDGFVEVHPRRLGGTKRGLPVWPIEHVAGRQSSFVLVAVGSPGARDKIHEWMNQHEKEQGGDYLFVA